MKLLIASNNKHKIEEIKTILHGKFEEIVSLAEMNICCDPKETGLTFEENAIIKATEIGKLCNLPVLADDTGLCVASLNGMPGVYSARYAATENNAGHDDAANRKRLLRELDGKTNREAYFECVVALRYPNGELVTASGRVDGCILKEELGENGFGYDSLFYSYELQKTFAQASAEEKNAVSHRGRALQNLLCKL